MRYVFRVVKLLIFWPCKILLYSIIFAVAKILSIIWWLRLDKGIKHENFWYFIDDGYETTENGLRFYEEFYKTPMDCILDRRYKVYKKSNNF